MLLAMTASLTHARTTMPQYPFAPTTATTLATGTYLAATTAELELAGLGRHALAAVDRTALFERRGRIVLREDELLLEGWDGRELRVDPHEIRSVRREYTSLFGRLAGGLRDAGKPLIIDSSADDELYLLVDHRGANHNRQWEQMLRGWVASYR